MNLYACMHNTWSDNSAGKAWGGWEWSGEGKWAGGVGDICISTRKIHFKKLVSKQKQLKNREYDC